MSDNIKDVLEEAVHIYKPVVIISEWIPFGSNQFSHFAEALSAYKRGEIFITSIVDKMPETAFFNVEPKLAWIRIMDYKEANYVKFIARIYYPEDQGIIQKEELGITVNVDGFVYYSARINKCYNKNNNKHRALGNKKFSENYVSLDKLSRIITDLLEDTSTLMQSLLTSYQRRILEVVYPRSEEEIYERRKEVAIITTEAYFEGQDLRDLMKEESFKAEYFKIGSTLRGKLQQVIGYIEEVKVLSNDDLIIVGREGIFVLTTEERIAMYKEILRIVLGLRALYSFYFHLFSRIWIIWDDIGDIRTKLFGEDRYEKSLSAFRTKLSMVLSDMVVLWDVDRLAKFSINRFKNSVMKSLANENSPLREIINPEEFISIIETKIEATKSVLEAFKMDLDGLTTLMGTLAEEKMREIENNMRKSLDQQVKMMRIERAEKERLEIIEYLSAGLLIAEILSLLFAWLQEAYNLTFGGWEYLVSIFLIFILAVLLRQITARIKRIAEESEET